MSQVEIHTDPVTGRLLAVSHPDAPLSRRDRIRLSARGGYPDPDRPFTRRAYSWADAFDALERREHEHGAVAALLTNADFRTAIRRNMSGG